MIQQHIYEGLAGTGLLILTFIAVTLRQLLEESYTVEILQRLHDENSGFAHWKVLKRVSHSSGAIAHALATKNMAVRRNGRIEEGFQGE